MATYYVDGAVGDNGNLGTSEGAGNAWATIQYAVDQITQGDIIYIKASAAYAEDITISTFGQSTNPIKLIGYASTPGDHGKITINPTTVGITMSYTSFMYYVFQNLIIDGASSHGVSAAGTDQMVWFNCEFNNNGGVGCFVDNNNIFVACEARNNGSHGFQMGTTTYFAYNIARGNGDSQVNASGGFYAFNEFSDGTNLSPYLVEAGPCEWFMHNTLDMNSVVSLDGVNFSGSRLLALNNVFTNAPADYAMVTNAANACRVKAYNLRDNVATMYFRSTDPGIQGLGDINGTAGFTDSATGDYTLLSTSDARGTALTPGGIT